MEDHELDAYLVIAIVCAVLVLIHTARGTL